MRDPETKWPLVEGTDGKERAITLPDQCVIMGNKSWRDSAPAQDRAAVDIARRSTPVVIWREIFGELCDGYDYIPYGQSVEEGDNDADMYGFTFDEDDNHADADAIYQYRPEPKYETRRGRGDKMEQEEWAEWGRRERPFRAAIQFPHRRNTLQPPWGSVHSNDT